MNNLSRDLSPTRRYPFAHQDHRYNNNSRHFDGRREVYSSLGDYRHDYPLIPRGGRRNVYSSLGDYGNTYTESQNRFYPGYRNIGNYQRHSGLDLRWKHDCFFFYWTNNLKKLFKNDSFYWFFPIYFETTIITFYWKNNYIERTILLTTNEMDGIWPIILRTNKINFFTNSPISYCSIS